MFYLYFINLTYNAITDKFRCCQEGDRKRQGYQAEGQYNFVERKHIRLANKWLNFPLLRKAAIMGSATCNFSERVNVLNGVASVVLKYAMHVAGTLS